MADTVDAGDATTAEGMVDVVDVPLGFLDKPKVRRNRICHAA